MPPAGWASGAAALSRRALALSLRFDAQVFSLNIPRRLTKMWSLMKEDDGFVCFKDVTAGNPPACTVTFPAVPAHTCAHRARHPRVGGCHPTGRVRRPRALQSRWPRPGFDEDSTEGKRASLSGTCHICAGTREKVHRDRPPDGEACIA